MGPQATTTLEISKPCHQLKNVDPAGTRIDSRYPLYRSDNINVRQSSHIYSHLNKCRSCWHLYSRYLLYRSTISLLYAKAVTSTVSPGNEFCPTTAFKGKSLEWSVLLLVRILHHDSRIYYTRPSPRTPKKKMACMIVPPKDTSQHKSFIEYRPWFSAR